MPHFSWKFVLCHFVVEGLVEVPDHTESAVRHDLFFAENPPYEDPKEAIIAWDPASDINKVSDPDTLSAVVADIHSGDERKTESLTLEPYETSQIEIYPGKLYTSDSLALVTSWNNLQIVDTTFVYVWIVDK